MMIVFLLRPGKLDLLFLISFFLDLGEGGRSLFIIHLPWYYRKGSNYSATLI